MPLHTSWQLSSNGVPVNVRFIISIIALAAILIPMKLWLAPQFVAAYGVGGAVVLIAIFYGIAVLIDRKDRKS